VGQTRSFRRAAERCHVSQPSLSAQVAEAERALGTRLFDRDRRQVIPTPAGAALLERIQALLLAADDLVSAAGALQDPLAGPLRLGVIPTIAPYLLPGLLPALRRHFPRLQPLWHEDRTRSVAALVSSGELAGALVALEAPLPRLVRRPIGDDPFLLCASPQHPLARGKGPLPLSALAGQDVLLLDEGHCLREQALAVCSTQGAHEPGLRATSLPTLVQMVAAGAGVTLLPLLAAPVERRRAPVVLRRFRAPEPKRTLGLVWREGSALGPALERLAGAIEAAHAARLPEIVGADPQPRARGRKR
jgi:LysR family transcriptional regulator, hydrogen peroxide-inducible genes activator